jgi:hypothetical protein
MATIFILIVVGFVGLLIYGFVVAEPISRDKHGPLPLPMQTGTHRLFAHTVKQEDG